MIKERGITMFDTMWNDIEEKNQFIIKSIAEYNIEIKSGKYLEYENELDMTVYYNFVAAHIISLLFKDKLLYLSNNAALLLNVDQSSVSKLINWELHENNRLINAKNSCDVIKQIVSHCFDENAKNFIQEICAQDIIHSQKLAKEISSIMGLITAAIIVDCKGEDELFKEFSRIRNGEGRTSTTIEDRFHKEYRSRGALIRNRVFKQKNIYRNISDKVRLTDESDDLLDYRYDKNVCQSALLHIGIEETGSSGTGFVISEDGYALTCAHVVEGAKDVYATVINGDGYPVGDKEGFEVYDAGDGKVVYSNNELDIALLKMEHFGSGFLPIEQRNILPELGEEVVVFGYPLGYQMPQSNFFGPNISFYKGYVSSNQVKDGNSVTFLDIDIKSGNSGSPVISTKTGKVIGIISGVKVGGNMMLKEKMPYMIPIQHFVNLIENDHE